MSASTPTDPAEQPNALRRGPVHTIRGWRWLLFWPAALGLDLYYRTVRLRFRPEELAAARALEGPRLVVIWHNRSLLFAHLVRPVVPRGLFALISASKMAAWQVAYFEHRGIPAIRGSSTRGGSIAVKEALRSLRRGQALAISPDGPSGPLYEVKRGTVALARHAHASLLLIAANAPRARRLKTWDRHLMPWPGQSVEVRIRILSGPEAFGEATDEEACAQLRAALLEINDE